ncbi:MAG TPA: glycosyltransferase family 4 protein [Thermoanaerobaculia bacterium]|nr:glycosyltransferase family 4 protein [Thermoanaerobaculia bacterium]
MRLLHILSQRPGRSGSGVFLKAMVREAAKRGYRQHAIVAGPPETSAAEVPPLTVEEVSLITFPSPEAPFPVPGNSDVMPYPSTVFSGMTETQVEQYLAASRRVMEEVRERFRPDLVHTHHLWLMTSLAREVFADLPVVTTSHNAELRQLVKAPHLAPRVLPGIRRLDRICVLTPRSVRDTLDAYGVAEERIALTGAGYDAALFHPPSEPPEALREDLARRFGVHLPPGRLVTFVGRLSTPKGIPFLLAAAAEGGREGAPPFRLVLVGATGTGEDGRRMDELVQAAGGLVTHLGAQPQEAVARVLQLSDLFVLPSLFEGLPLTMLEAAACGCPCLVSGLPTIASWVPEEWTARGWFELVPPLATTDADRPVEADVPRFVDALAGALRRQLARARRPEERTELAGRLRGHSWSAVFERYEAVYGEVCGVTRGASGPSR